MIKFGTAGLRGIMAPVDTTKIYHARTAIGLQIKLLLLSWLYDYVRVEIISDN